MILHISDELKLPKYRQIIDGVTLAIREKRVRKGDSLPSASALCKEFHLARETVLKAYAELKSLGVVEAIPRKGYFVATESIEHTHKVLLVMDEFSPYKQDLYDAFRKRLGKEAVVDVYFHHCNPATLKNLLRDKIDAYSEIVLTPFDNPEISEILSDLAPEKLLVLDRSEHTGDRYSFIGQDFDAGLYEALDSVADRFARYERVCLVFRLPSEVMTRSNQSPVTIPVAFKRFCKAHSLKHTVLHEVGKIKKGDAYFVIDDADLVMVVEQAMEKKLTLGKDVGILAYNETHMRKVVGEGITVISTDFKAMGRHAAEYVLNDKKEKTKQIIPTRVIQRRSL